VGYIAHYDLGFSRQEIRTQAVICAVIIGLLMARIFRQETSEAHQARRRMVELGLKAKVK
jgi:hypothetical protein